MKYIVTRIANNNPDINGQKLYLTKLGYWSLNSAHARAPAPVNGQLLEAA